ncbi:hypothetical protein FJQ98_14805 [Lysinibacillus agricola]|uniref:Uncharacterized protein n=1 Tax=Lysinibacillus agricola TaxID=2590012 RepID=A0ABX7ALK8_9BACI|nr:MULTISPECIES: hypothetical protein [Lysinibacillus]QQP10544.1 hypothetical protein FJQ98_14805 [Lysinibacillus agricola]
MKFTFELGVNTTPDKNWSLYANINEWFKWESDLKDISLNGEFVKGSTGIMRDRKERSPFPISLKVFFN